MTFFSKLLPRLVLARQKTVSVSATQDEAEHARPTCQNCGKARPIGLIKVDVLGVACEFNDPPMCPTCAHDYLNKFSTLCHVCGQPIFPGTAVESSGNTKNPHNHADNNCSQLAGLYCGTWGEGKLIPYHASLKNAPADS